MSNPQSNWEMMLEKARQSPPKTRAELHEEARRLPAQPQQPSAKDYFWQKAGDVRQALRDSRRPTDSRVLAASGVQAYQFISRHNLPLGGLLLDAVAQRNSVGAWNMLAQLSINSEIRGSTTTNVSELYLVEDGSLLGFRGMTDRAWECGILVGEILRRPGEDLPQQHNYDEAMTGLAHLVVKHKLPL